jgi:transcriptional regulator NrdR family protein
MICKHCESKNTYVKATCHRKEGKLTIRYWRCRDCGGKYKTEETYLKDDKKAA